MKQPTAIPPLQNILHGALGDCGELSLSVGIAVGVDTLENGCLLFSGEDALRISSAVVLPQFLRDTTVGLQHYRHCDIVILLKIMTTC
jgi:hypothetical protein